VREEKAFKAKPLKKLAPSDQIACRILAEAGGFDSATVISLEFNAGTLEKYICKSHCLGNSGLCCFLYVHVFLHCVSNTAFPWCRFENKPRKEGTTYSSSAGWERGFAFLQ